MGGGGWLRVSAPEHGGALRLAGQHVGREWLHPAEAAPILGVTRSQRGSIFRTGRLAVRRLPGTKPRVLRADGDRTARRGDERARWRGRTIDRQFARDARRGAVIAVDGLMRRARTGTGAEHREADCRRNGAHDARLRPHGAG